MKHSFYLWLIQIRWARCYLLVPGCVWVVLVSTPCAATFSRREISSQKNINIFLVGTTAISWQNSLKWRSAESTPQKRSEPAYLSRSRLVSFVHEVSLPSCSIALSIIVLFFKCSFRVCYGWRKPSSRSGSALSTGCSLPRAPSPLVLAGQTEVNWAEIFLPNQIFENLAPGQSPHRALGSFVLQLYRTFALFLLLAPPQQGATAAYITIHISAAIRVYLQIYMYICICVEM